MTVYRFTGAFAKLRKVTFSFVMSVCPSVRPLSAYMNSAPTGRIIIKFDVFCIFRNFVEKIHVYLKSYKKTGTLQICTQVA